jgi:uncharacterized protein involved in exopolysaccharide biosynthesis
MTEPTPRRAQSRASQDLTLRDLIEPLFRRKRAFSVSLFVFLAGAIVGTIALSGQYKASMEVLVNRQRLDPLVTAEATVQTPPNPPPVSEEEINSEVELLKSSELLREVALTNHLQERERKTLLAMILPRQSDDWYIARAMEKLSKRLTTEVVKKTNMIEVSYKSSDPQVSYAVLNKLAGLYMEKHIAVQRPTGSYEFFSKESERYKQALAVSEMHLASFGKTEGVAAPDVVRTDMAQEVVNSISALHQAQQAISADEHRIADEQAQLAATPSRSSTQEVSNSAEMLLQQLMTNLLSGQIKRTQLALKYDPTYPLVQEADQEIAQTEAAIAEAKKTQFVNQTTDRDPTYELLKEDIVKTQADLASQKATATAIERSLGNLQGEMVALDQKAVRQTNLLREAKLNEANYLLYSSKREQERTSDALDQKRIGNVAIAVPPTVPVLPAYSPVTLLPIGFLLAIFGSVGIAYVAEYLDPCFRTPGEVADLLQVPVLASVPRQSAQRRTA